MSADRSKAWRLANPERYRSTLKKWRDKNRTYGVERHRAWRAKNSVTLKQKQRAYYQKNKEHLKERSRARHHANRPAILVRHRAWYRRNRTEQQVLARNYERNRSRTDPAFRLRGALRSRIRIALRNAGVSKGGRKTVSLIGCTIPDLRAHLERQFTPGITWRNYGSVWHVDHITPCAYFDLSQPEEQRRCFHFTNLRPLLAPKNVSRGSRAGHVQQRLLLPM